MYDFEGVKDYFGEGAFEVWQDPNASVFDRMRAQREAYSNMTVTPDSVMHERLRAAGARPDYLYEDQGRRARWAHTFRAPAFQGDRNALLRRGAEVVLDNVWSDAVMAWGDRYPELNRMTPRDLMENTTTAVIAPQVTVQLAIARRLVPDLLFNTLFTVIPIAQLDAKVPFLKRKYDTTITGGATTGNEIFPYSGANYDAAFSGGRVYSFALGTGTGGAQNFDLDRTPTYAHKVYVDGVLQVLTTDYTIGVGAGAGGVDRVQFVAAPALSTVLTCTYDARTEGANANKVRLEMELIDVEHEEHVLGHIFSLKAMQSMNAYFAINMLTENPLMLQQEIYKMIDTLTLTHVHREASGTAANFSITGFLPGDTTSTARKDYNRTVYDKMVDVHQGLYQTYRMVPQYFVCGSTLGGRLMKLEDWRAAPGAAPGRMQVQQRTLLGTVGDRWLVYQSPDLPADEGFFGWPTLIPYQTNYVITMYNPFFLSPQIWDSALSTNSGQFAQVLMGRKMIDSGQFGTLIAA